MVAHRPPRVNFLGRVKFLLADRPLQILGGGGSKFLKFIVKVSNMPKWNWSDWGSLEVGVHSLCESAVTLLGELLKRLTAKRAKIEAPGAQFYKLPDEVGKPFHEAMNTLSDISYRIREGMEWKEIARKELSRIKDELIPQMRERLEGDAQLEGLLSAIEKLCNQAHWMVSPWGASSSGAGQTDVGEASSEGVSTVRKAIEALRLTKSRLHKAESEEGGEIPWLIGGEREEWEKEWRMPRGKIRIATANIRGHWSFVEDSLNELNISGKEVKEVRAALTKLINAVNNRVSAEDLKETAEAFGVTLAGFVKWLKQQFSGEVPSTLAQHINNCGNWLHNLHQSIDELAAEEKV
jgi:hypothetical protein